ncbi:MAG: peptidylprolyl isomerase [Phycisphaerales bacterium]|nr:peptidylprolyl isomerase [Phycisphaerales bacterium]
MLEQLEGRLVMSTIIKLDTTMGNIGFQLDEAKAPITVTNFMNYLTSGRFVDDIVHRSQSGFVVQLGAYKFTTTDAATGTGTVDNVQALSPIVREITGISNKQKTLAMARTSVLGSATSSFFINLADNSGILDPAPGSTTTTGGGYAAFGEVIYGWDVVLAIAALPVSSQVPPINLPSSLGGTPIASTTYVAGTAPKYSDLVIVKSMKVVDLTANRAIVGSTPAASYTVFEKPDGSGFEEYLFPGMIGVGNKPTVFVPPVAKDTWRAVDLSSVASPVSPAATGGVQTWADPVDNSSRAAVPTADGLYVFYRNPLGGVWTSSNLTTGLPGGRVITSEITVFRNTDAEPLMHIVGLTSDNHVVMYREVLQPLDDQGRRPRSKWEFIDITEDHLAAQGLATPAFTGRLISYVTSWGGLNIAGLDSNGDIHTVWWAPGLSMYTTSNLSQITGAPKFTGGLAAYLTSWGGINLAGVQTDGKVAVTWWVPSFGGNWVNNNFTDEFGGPKLSADSLTTYVMDAWGGLNIVGIDSDSGKMSIYWWSPGLTVWNVTQMDTITGYVPPVGRLAAAVAPSGRTSIVGTAASGEFMQYTWAPGQQWDTVNITYNSLFSTGRT